MEEKKALLTAFLDFADPIYWAENHITDRKDLIDEFLKLQPSLPKEEKPEPSEMYHAICEAIQVMEHYDNGEDFAMHSSLRRLREIKANSKPEPKTAEALADKWIEDGNFGGIDENDKDGAWMQLRLKEAFLEGLKQANQFK